MVGETSPHAGSGARGTNLVLTHAHAAEHDPACPDLRRWRVSVEPHENKLIDLQKAVSAHEQAEAALADLMNVSSDPRFGRMLERIQANMAELRSQAATTDPNPAEQS
jgi:hypothetical protein